MAQADVSRPTPEVDEGWCGSFSLSIMMEISCRQADEG
jgi:hypothetical protein